MPDPTMLYVFVGCIAVGAVLIALYEFGYRYRSSRGQRLCRSGQHKWEPMWTSFSPSSWYGCFRCARCGTPVRAWGEER